MKLRVLLILFDANEVFDSLRSDSTQRTQRGKGRNEFYITERQKPQLSL